MLHSGPVLQKDILAQAITLMQRRSVRDVYLRETELWLCVNKHPPCALLQLLQA